MTESYDTLQRIQTAMGEEAVGWDEVAQAAESRGEDGAEARDTARLLDSLSGLVDYTRRVYGHREDLFYAADKTSSLLDASISVAYWVLTSIAEDAREPEVYRMRKLLEEITGAVYRATWASVDARPIYRSDADSYLRLADDFAAWAKEQDAVAIPDPED
jgi:hypothetical protein